MKKIDVIYNLYGYIDEVSDSSIHFEQENDSLQINATIETDKKVRAYIKAPNNNSTVTDELTPVGGVYSCSVEGEYMAKGTMYVGYELYDDTGYIERLEPLKIYIDSFVSLDGSNSDNVYVVTVTVGKVETVPFEQSAAVENVGTKKDMILNFKIPRGETGLKGEKGDKGDTGAQGIQGERGLQGEQGPQGIQGEKGDDSNIANISISCTEFPYDATELDSVTGYGMYYIEYGDYLTYDGHCFMSVEGNSDEGWISQTLTLGETVLRREYNYYNIDFEEGSWTEWSEKSASKKYVDDSLKAKAEKTEIPTKLSQLTDDITEQTYNSASTKPQSGMAVAEAIAKLLGSAPENLDTLEELAKALNEDENFSATVLAELAEKQPKEDGKGLSSNDFTNVLLNKLNGISNNATNSPEVIKFEFENENDERIHTWINKSIFNQFYNGFYYITMYYVYESIGGDYQESVLLLCNSHEDGGLHTDRMLIDSNGHIYTNQTYDDGNGGQVSDEWKKISVSQTDLNNAIGDIETSLDNIITKYGLGGDSV